MSFQAFAWAVTVHPGSAAEKLVLLGLADRHNTEHNYAYPSTAWLTEFSGLDRKTVITALDRLEAAKLIRDTRLRVGKTKQIKVYSLVMESLPKTEASQKRNSSVFSEEGSQKRDTDTVKEPLTSRAKALSVARGAWALPVGVSLQVWTDFLANRRKKRLTNTPTAWKGFLSDLSKVSALTGIPPPKLIEQCTAKGWASINDPRDENDRRTNGLGRHQSSDGLSPTTRAALKVFGSADPGEQRRVPQ